jgi:3-dehydroquinate synthase
MRTAAGSEPIVVDLADRSYPVYVGAGLLRETGRLMRDHLMQAGRCAVVTSPPINEIYGETISASLEEAGFESSVCLVPDGEEAKTWSTAEALIGGLLDAGLDRSSVVVALGGGAVGDVAGFASSIFLRGVRFVQVPTTLLAQVDSSIGGKTAVNHPRGKNLIGSFYQPSLVVSDPELVSTLPRRELLSGLGEVVKHGVIADLPLFNFTERNAERLIEADPEALAHVVQRSVTMKRELVALDERDSKGARAVLNYGHTLGHALETLTRHELRHGEAVAHGMVYASRLAIRFTLMGEEEAGRQRSLLEVLGFDLEPPQVGRSSLLEAMHRDKKAEGGSIRFILPTGIGTQPVLKAIQDDVISQELEVEGYE